MNFSPTLGSSVVQRIGFCVKDKASPAPAVEGVPLDAESPLAGEDRERVAVAQIAKRFSLMQQEFS
jgi:hypothetical protein